jgi:3-oxoacyl-[acyl-carrier-protein] synthase-3
MNGPEIFSFTAESVPILIKESLIKNNLKESDINMYIFHQANKFMLEFLKKIINISDEKFFTFYENIGNTVSSTIPIALSEAIKENKLSGNVLIAGFGVGYSWGSTILNFK